MSNSLWSILDGGDITGDTLWYTGKYGNRFFFGARLANAEPQGGLLKPEEVWNIDTKMDDGKPGIGKIWVFGRVNCTDSASATDYDSEYLLTNSTAGCGIVFLNQF